jgi:hypothetical protein
VTATLIALGLTLSLSVSDVRSVDRRNTGITLCKRGQFKFQFEPADFIG